MISVRNSIWDDPKTTFKLNPQIVQMIVVPEITRETQTLDLIRLEIAFQMTVAVFGHELAEPLCGCG